MRAYHFNTCVINTYMICCMLDYATLPYLRSKGIFGGLNVTGYWKTDWIVTLGLFHFICPANSYTCTLHIHSAITGLGWLVCFSRVSFADPVNAWQRQWDPWRALHERDGSEIHFSDGEMSINAIQACVGLWLALLRPIASPNNPNGGFSPPPASHLPPTPASLPSRPPTPITFHQWYYSGFEKVVQNLAVLAS